ncbi:glycosyltransferase family 4 protein [Bacillus sp. FSL W7-1360]
MIKLTMLSSAEKVKGQGVASAYRELLTLMEQQVGMYDLKVNQFDSCDITHYHTIDFRFYLSTFFRRRRGVKVGYVHFLPETVDESLKLPAPIRAIFYKYVVAFYQRMDHLVVVNPTFIPKLEALGIAKEKVHYIPNFVSKKMFREEPEEVRWALREKHEISKEAFVVVGAGQVQHRKGILDFVEVAKQLPHIQFIWVGGFSFGKITAGYEQLKAIVDHPPANVRFTGIVDRETMGAYYNLSDMLFLPSFNELFPMTILEAMSCGTPILLRDLDLYQDILFDYYYQASSVPTFVEMIENMRTDRDFYEQACQAARRGAYHYSEDRLAEVWNDFYARMASIKKVPVYEQ